MVLALRLAKGGWWGGDPGAIMAAPADEVLMAIRYEDFTGSYEAEILRMARESAS